MKQGYWGELDARGSRPATVLIISTADSGSREGHARSVSVKRVAPDARAGCARAVAAFRPSATLQGRDASEETYDIDYAGYRSSAMRESGPVTTPLRNPAHPSEVTHDLCLNDCGTEAASARLGIDRDVLEQVLAGEPPMAARLADQPGGRRDRQRGSLDADTGHLRPCPGSFLERAREGSSRINTAA